MWQLTLLTLKRHQFSGEGQRNFFNRLYTQNGLSHAPRTFTIWLSAPNTTRCETFIFGWTSPLPESPILWNTPNTIFWCTQWSKRTRTTWHPLRRHTYSMETHILYGHTHPLWRHTYSMETHILYGDTHTLWRHTCSMETHILYGDGGCGYMVYLNSQLSFFPGLIHNKSGDGVAAKWLTNMAEYSSLLHSQSAYNPRLVGALKFVCCKTSYIIGSISANRQLQWCLFSAPCCSVVLLSCSCFDKVSS